MAFDSVLTGNLPDRGSLTLRAIQGGAALSSPPASHGSDALLGYRWSMPTGVAVGAPYQVLRGGRPYMTGEVGDGVIELLSVTLAEEPASGLPQSVRAGSLEEIRAGADRTVASGRPLVFAEAEWGPFPPLGDTALIFNASRVGRHGEPPASFLGAGTLEGVAARSIVVPLAAATLNVPPGLWSWELLAVSVAGGAREVCRGTLRVVPALGPPPA